MVFAHILRQNGKRCDWSTSSGYMVSFCLPGPTPTASMVLSRCLRSTNRRDCFLIKQRIWRFLHDENVRWIQVSNNGITSVAKTRFRQSTPRFVRHCFVRLKQGRKPIVWIEAVLEEVNVESIVRSMVCEKELHQLTSPTRPEKTTHCYHVVLLLALCSTSVSASSTCERIGSFLHCVENGDAPIYAARIANRLRLKVSGFEGIGSERDEYVVGEISKSFQEMQKRPFLSVSGQKKRRRLGQVATGNIFINDRIADSSGRSFLMDREEGDYAAQQLRSVMTNMDGSIQATRAFHAPCHLDEGMMKDLQPVVRQKEHGYNVLALPVFVTKGRGAPRLLPQSSVRERMSRWLESEDGRQWNSQRQELWHSVMAPDA